MVASGGVPRDSVLKLLLIFLPVKNLASILLSDSLFFADDKKIVGFSGVDSLIRDIVPALTWTQT